MWKNKSLVALFLLHRKEESNIPKWSFSLIKDGLDYYSFLIVSTAIAQIIKNTKKNNVDLKREIPK